MCKYLTLPIIAILLFSCNSKNNKNMATGDTAEIKEASINDDSSLYLLIGTYTAKDSKGIYIYQFDTVSGLSTYKSMVEIVNPSYLTISKNEKHVYAVSEVGDSNASASAFSFDKEKGELKILNSQATDGADPCYITTDNTGKHVVTANYSGGNITVFDVKEDGSLTPASQHIAFSGKGTDPERQKKPHLHCVTYSPDGKYLFANDLGTDKIHKLEVTFGNSDSYLKAGNPQAFKVADMSGPRHLEFHPNGKYAYLINEISGTVIAFDYDSQEGNLSEIQTIKADSLNAQGSADIHITPDGKYLYASNRLKGDGLAIFSINQSDGKLTHIGYQETGIHPRNFVITPNGKYLLVASRDSDMIQVFRINKDGLLEDTHNDIKLSMPVCLKFASFK